MAVLTVAQAAQKYFDTDGITPLSGGKIYTYAAGTTTPLATYSDSAGTTPNANPITLDANGQALIYVTAGTSYDFVSKRSDGTQVGVAQRVMADGDNSVRTDLSSNTSALGSDLVGFVDAVVPSYLKTTSDVINGERVSVMRTIPKSKWAGIRAGTNTDNLYTYFNDLLSAMSTAGYGNLFVPRGTYNLTTGITVPQNVMMSGDGTLATKLKFALSGTNAVTLSNGSTVSDLTVDGTTTAVSCFLFSGVSEASVINCKALNAQSQGFAFTVGANKCMLTSVRAESCGSRGILIDRGTDTDPAAYNNIVNGAYIASCTNAAVLIGHNAVGNVVSNVTATGIANAAVWIHHGASKNVLDNIIIRASAAASGTPAMLVQFASTDNVVSNVFAESYDIGLLLRGGPADPNVTASDTKRNIFDNLRFIGPGTGVAGSAAVKIDSTDSGTTKVTDNWIRGLFASSYDKGIYDPAGNAAFDNFISDADLSGSVTTPFSLALTTSRTRLRNIRGYTPAGFIASPPAVASTGTAVTNNYPYPVIVYVKGMPAGGNVQINGAGVDPTAAPNDGNGPHLIQPQQTITLIYASGTPTWRWFGTN